MKKRLFVVVLFLCSFCSFGQIGLNENFDSGSAPNWTLDEFNISPIVACAGESARANLYSSNTEAMVLSPNLVGQSNGTDLTVGFGYKVVDFSDFNTGAPAGWGSCTVEFSTDAGTTWSNLVTIDDSNHVVSGDCATLSYTIPAADLPTGSDFQIRFSILWADGDYFFYLDNIIATQVVSDPPNCDAALTSPEDGVVGAPVESNIVWSPATGIPLGYLLSIGTTPGGTDILNQEDVGNTTSYDPPADLAYDTTYYISIVPYNDNGNATGCTEYSFTTEQNTSQIVDCEVGPVTTVFCYEGGTVTEYTYTSSDGTNLNLNINAGEVEDGWDPFIVLDSDGEELYNGYGNAGDLTGLSFQSTGDNITVRVEADGLNSCADADTDYASIDLTVACATCTNPAATYTVVSDCLNGPQFFVEVDLTSLGDATDVDISDNQGSPVQTVSAIGIFTYGPYPNNTNVQISIQNNQDNNCLVSSGILTQEFCTENLVDCAVGPVNTVFCYENNVTTEFTYTSSDGNNLNLVVNAGQVENTWDEFIVLDSNGTTELYNGFGNAGDLAGLSFQSTGDNLTVRVTPDGSGDCATSEDINSIFLTVSCATCINPDVNFEVVSDCISGTDQFFVDVEITDLGSATTLNINDDQGSTEVSVTAIGTSQFGPYPNGTPVVITVANQDDGNCVITSPTLNQLACPPDNDDCDNATVLQVNSDNTCTLFTAGTLDAATNSSEINTCDGTINNDVWFEFVATETAHIIELSNVVSTTNPFIDVNHAVYEGGDCGTMTLLYCANGYGPDISVAGGLTIGNTYTIRVYAPYDSGSDTSFDICVRQAPTPPANDDCDNASLVSVNVDGTCTMTTPGTVEGATASAAANGCNGNADDDVWFEFVATDTSHIIDLLNVTGSTTDLFHAIYEGDNCGALVELACSDLDHSFLTDLTIGETYKIRVYTYTATALQNTSFDVCVSIQPSPPVNDDCDMAMEIPVNETDECLLVTPGTIGGATPSNVDNTCGGTADDDVWFEFTATATSQTISLLNISNTSTDLYHSLYEGDECGNMTLLYCADGFGQTNSSANNLTIGNNYMIRIWSATNVGGYNTSFDLCIATPEPPISTSTDEYTMEELVKDVLFGNPCVQVFNITSSTGTDYGQANGIGYFEQNGSIFPIESGIVMNTGSVSTAPGPETGTQGTETNAWLGDADMEAIIPGLDVSNNASIIEFDFIPLQEDISFDFLFASDEYGQFQCSFADAFGFLLTDANGITTNIAVVPGTTDPISVLTVRDEAYNTPFNTCSSVNPEYFNNYYGPAVPSGEGEDPLTAPVNYTGTTVVMTAQATVVPGDTYHIKLVIVDRSDSSYNSAIFLEAGSFNIGQLDLGPDITLDSGNANCAGDPLLIDSGLEADPNVVFEWYLDGIVIPDEIGPTIEVTESGDYTIVVYYFGVCGLSDAITVEFYENPEIELGPDQTVCDVNFTLDATPTNAAELSNISYIWSLDGTVIAGETAATLNVTAPGTYEVEVMGNGCPTIDSIVITLDPANFTVDLGGDQSVCNQASYTIASVITGEDGSTATYLWTPNGETTPEITVDQDGTYAVTVTINSCSVTESVDVSFNDSPIFDLGADVATCDLGALNLILDATPSNFTVAETTFEWSKNGTVLASETGPTLMVTTFGTYSVTAFADDPSCTFTDEIVVSESDLVTVSINANDEDNLFCSGETVTLNAELTNALPAEVDFVWFKNGTEISGETSATLNVTESGTYTVEVGYDSCMASSEIEIAIEPCSIPQGISPNGDQYNQRFDLGYLRVNSIEIFNRNGRSVYSKTGGYTDEWEGQTDGGDKLVTGTYYYVIKLEDGESFKGKQVLTGWVYINREIN